MSYSNSDVNGVFNYALLAKLAYKDIVDSKQASIEADDEFDIKAIYSRRGGL